MYQHDARHSGRSPYAGPEQPQLKWVFNTGTGLELIGAPVIDTNGIIYISSNDRHLYTINPDGRLKWSKPMGVGFQASPAIGPDGTIYLGTLDSPLQGLVATYPDGSPKWRSVTDGSVLNPPVIGADGTIYLTTPFSLYALNPDGNVKWKYTIGTGGTDILVTPPAVGPDGTILVGHQYQKLYAITSSGGLKWIYSIDSENHGFKVTPSVDLDGTVYAGSDYGRLYAIAPGGTLKWEFSTFGHSGIFTTPAIGGNGKVYLGHYNGRIYALNQDGSLRWEFYSGDYHDIFSSAVVDGNDIIYVTSEQDNSLYAFNPDGTRKWRFELNADVGGEDSPVIGADQTIYVNSRDGKLLAIGVPLQRNVRLMDFKAPYLNRDVDAVMADGTAYWYFQLLEEDGTPAAAGTVNLELSMPGRRIFPKIERFPESILRLGVDINDTGVREGGTAVISFPDQIEIDGRAVVVSEKPAPISLTKLQRAHDLTWDIFAGSSAGVIGSVGSIGAGPSVAIAKLSIKGEGGMGLKIAVDENGIFELSRRFESGVALEAKVPSVNLTIGDVDIGIKSNIVAKAQLGQTVRFDSALGSDEVQLAQAGYLLETASLGGVSLSPLAGVVLNAITTTLNNLTGVHETFDRYLFEVFSGLGLEGEIGAKIGASLGENSPLDFSFFEAQRRVAMQVKLVQGLRSPGYLKVEPELGMDFELNLIRATLKPVDKVDLEIANPTLFGLGASMYLAPVMTFDSNKKPIDARIKFESGRELNTIYGTVANKTFATEIIISEQPLGHLIGLGSNLDKLNRAYDGTGTRTSMEIGPTALVNDVVNIIHLASNYVSQGGEPILIEASEKYGNGYDLDLELSLEGALGVGAGISLGVEANYYSSLEYLRKRSVLLDSLKAYLIESYPDDLRLTDFAGLKPTLEKLLSGVVPLIGAALENLVDFFKSTITPNEKFTLEATGGTGILASVSGTLHEAGEFILATLNPASDRVIFAAFRKPEIRRIYMSHKIARQQAEGILEMAAETATLILVSDNIILNFHPQAGGVAAAFEPPVQLSIAIQESRLLQNGFNVADKDSVRLYAYDDTAHTWIRFEQDLNASPDTVAAAVGRPGSYALGIEISPEQDTEPPGIGEIFPSEGSTVGSRPLLQARITDAVHGSGVSLADCRLELDGRALDASWNPRTQVLYYQVQDNMSDGGHTLAIFAADHNGNTASAAVSFIVDATTQAPVATEAPGKFVLHQNYPNPFNTNTRISYVVPAAGTVEITIYDAAGHFVKALIDGYQAPGEHAVEWDGTNAGGKTVASGTYFYQVKFGDFNAVRRMTLVR